MFEEPICHFRGVKSILLFNGNNVNPNQMPHDVVSDLGLNCLSMTLL